MYNETMGGLVIQLLGFLAQSPVMYISGFIPRGQMSLEVKISQRAMSSMSTLPKNVQAKAARAIDLLQSDDEKSIRPNKLKGGRNLYSGRLNNRFCIIYSKKDGSITIVDFIKVDDVSNIMRSDV